MVKLVTFLRAINVSGTRIKMADLKKLYGDMGFSNVTTFLHSGNVLFESSQRKSENFRLMIENNFEKKFGFRSIVVIRTLTEINNILENKPFKNFKELSPSHQMVMLFNGKVASNALSIIKTEHEQIWCKGSETYITYPNGVGGSKLTTKKIERCLSIEGTMRNISTLRKILEYGA